MSKNKALFLDLDGTLIQTKSGNTFGADKDDWKFRPKMLSRVKYFYDKGYYIIIVSNQAGVDEGRISPRELTSKICLISEQVCNFLRKSEYKYTSWEIGHDDKVHWMIADSFNHVWRKPNPDAAYFAADKFNLDLKQCVMVGNASGLSRVAPLQDQNAVYIEGDRMYWKIGHGFKIEAHDVIYGSDNKFYSVEKDFSDSDKKFAENAGIGKYYDVEEFVKLGLDELC